MISKNRLAQIRHVAMPSDLVPSEIVLELLDEIEAMSNVVQKARDLLDAYDEVHWRDPEHDLKAAITKMDALTSKDIK